MWSLPLLLPSLIAQFCNILHVIAEPHCKAALLGLLRCPLYVPCAPACPTDVFVCTLSQGDAVLLLQLGLSLVTPPFPILIALTPIAFGVGVTLDRFLLSSGKQNLSSSTQDHGIPVM